MCCNTSFQLLARRILLFCLPCSGSTAVFIGNIIRKGTEFVFNNEATISGNPGTITMSVFDKDNKFSKDTQRISLKPGKWTLISRPKIESCRTQWNAIEPSRTIYRTGLNGWVGLAEPNDLCEFSRNFRLRWISGYVMFQPNTINIKTSRNIPDILRRNKSSCIWNAKLAPAAI